VQSRRRQRLFQRWSIGVLAAFDHGEFVDDLPVAAVEIRGDRGLLGVETEPRLSLAARADPIITDEFPVVRGQW